MNKLQTLDYITIIIYMLMMAGIGIFLGKYIKNISDYFKGGSGVSWIAGGISNFMTKFSTFVFVAYAGIAYTDGMVAITLMWSTILPSIIAVFVYAKLWKRAGIISPVEFLETRYNAPIRQIFSWSGVLLKLLDDMIKLYSIGIFVTAVSGIPFQTAVIYCGLVVAIYTVVGGFLAVIVTDVVQFIILFFATLILVPLAYNAAGGLSNMRQVIPENMSFFNGHRGVPFFLLVYYLTIVIKYLGNWTFIQRFYSAKSEEDGKKIGWLSAALFLVFPVIFLFPSVAARVIVPDLANPEMAYVAVCLKLLPAGIMGLMIAAMFAATMSVLSAEFNVTASVLTRDIYQRLFRKNAKPKETLWVARIMTLAVGLIVALGALYVHKLGGAFQVNQYLSGIFAIPLIIPVIMGVIFWRPQPWGAIASMVIGITVGVVLTASKQFSWEMTTLIEVLVCLAVFFASGFFLSKDRTYNEKVTAFFKKLATPAPKELATDQSVVGGFMVLYAIAFLITGSLFVVMGLPSIALQSGKLAIGSGIFCLIGAAVFYSKRPRTIKIIGTSSRAKVHTLFVIVFCFSQTCYSQPAIVKKQFHLYLLAGQSNMAGRGTVEAEDTVINKRIWVLNKQGKWQLAKEPLHFDKPSIAGVGPGYAFAKKMSEQDTNIIIGLVPSAVGGSPIAMWEPSRYYEPTKSYPYDDALRRTKLAMKDGVLKGILWHQGESDSDSSQAIVYSKKLVALVKRFRKDLKIKSLPFVAGTIADFYVATHPFGKQMNAGIKELPQRLKKVAAVQTDGLMHKGDVTHFNSASARAVGLRYATVFINELNKN